MERVFPPEELKFFYLKAYKIWRAKRFKARKVSNLDDHRCLTEDLSPKCPIAHLHISLFSKASASSSLHVCVEGVCMRENANKHVALVKGGLDDMFICRDTGKVHLCGHFCDPTLYGDAITKQCKLAEIVLFAEVAPDSIADKKRQTLIYYDAVYSKWKDSIARHWVPMSTVQLKNHHCYTEKQDSIPHCQIAHIIATVFEISQSEVHLCIHGYCDFDNEHDPAWTKVAYLEDLYVCQRSTKPHLCGPFCDHSYDIVTASTETVCSMSSLAHSNHAMRRTNYIVPGNSNGVTLPKNPQSRRPGLKAKTEFVLENVEDLIATCVYLNPKDSRKELLEKLRVIDTRNVPLRSQYFHSAIYTLAHVFSKDRFQSDRNNMLAIENDLKSQFDRYVSGMGRSSNQLISADDLYMIATQQMQKGYNVPNFARLTDDHRRELIVRYATKCVIFWYILRTETTKGREHPEEMPWLDFIDSALITFRSGVKFSQDCVRECVIIEEDPFLNMLPDTSDYLSINHQTVTKKPKKKSTTKICTFIRTAMMEAVTVQGLNPQKLSPDRYTIDQLDETPFLRIKSHGKG